MLLVLLLELLAYCMVYSNLHSSQKELIRLNLYDGSVFSALLQLSDKVLRLSCQMGWRA